MAPSDIVATVLFLALAFLPPITHGEPAAGEKGEADPGLAALGTLQQRVRRLRQLGKYDEAIPLAEAVLATQQRIDGANPLRIADSMNGLAELYTTVGQHEKAFTLLESSLTVRKRILGKAHADVIRTQTNLADLLARTGHHQRALALFRSTLAAQQASLGPDHLSIAANLESIGYLYQELGDYDQSLDFLQRAMAMRQRLLGGRHPLVARSMASLAVLYEGLGRPDKAFELQQLALAIRQKALGADHPDVAESMIHLAYLHQGRGEHEQALARCKSAIAIQEKKLSRQHPQTAASMDLLANLQRQTGTMESALLTAESALTMRRALFGEEHPDVAASLHTLARVLQAKGERAKALELHKKALAMREQLLGADDPELLGSLDDLAILYEETGDHARALPLCRAAFDLVRKYEIKGSGELLSRQDTLARLYGATGDYRRALELHEAALKLYRSTEGSSDAGLATRLEQLARVHAALGSRPRALEIQKQALLLRKQDLGEGDPDFGENLLSIAELHEATGDHAKAVPCYQDALEALKERHEEDHPSVVKAMNGLARIFESRGEIDKALVLLKTILTAQKKNLGENHLQVAETLARLGSLYKRGGNAQNALLSYQAALAIREQHLGRDHPDVAVSKNNLASLYQALGDPFRARPLYESALANFRKRFGVDHPQLMTIQNNLAILLAGLGDRMGARDLIKSSLLIEDDIYSELAPVLPSPRKLQFFADMESTADIYFSLLLTSSAALKEDRPEKLLEFAWSRKNLVADFALPEAPREVAHESQTTRDLAEELRSAQSALAELTFSPQPYLKSDDLIRRRKELRDEAQRIAIALSRLSPSFKEEHREHYVHVEDLLEVLPEDAALVEFFTVRWCDFEKQAFLGRHLVALVLTHHGGVRIRDVGDSKSLAELVRECREELASSYKEAPGTDPAAEPDHRLIGSPARKLHAQLFEPLRFRLEGIKKVYLAPAGVLHLLPFDALLTRTGEYFGDLYDLRLLSSGKDLIVPSRPRPESTLAIFADPSFDVVREVRSSGPFPPLKQTGDEAKALADHLGTVLPAKPELYLRLDASETELRSLKPTRVLHLATHSFVVGVPAEEDEERRFGTRTAEERLQAASELFRRTGLAFAGANQPARDNPSEDGRLSAAEIAEMRMEGAEMAVLSNNATNVIDQNAGQAAYALCRAFRLAGVPVLVRTLWQIPPAPREHILKKFYECYYTKRLPAPEALSEARKSLRAHGGPPSWNHPFLWSAFTVVQTGP